MYPAFLNARRKNISARGRACAIVLASLVACHAISGMEVSAAQLRLQREVHPNGALVVLGDVAEIIANDAGEAKRLSAIELFPTPAGARKRFLDVHELKDLLSRRDIDLANVTFSGASRITVHSMVAERPSPKISRSIAPASRRRAEARMRDLVIDHLRRQTGTEGPWTVQFSLADKQFEVLTNPDARVSVAGGRAPWTGSQSFTLEVELPEGVRQWSLDTIVTILPAVVVAARPLARGTLIRNGDVRLEFRSSLRQGAITFDRLDAVIGLETVQSIGAGETMIESQLQRPLLVKSGDAVTVYARSGGIQVRTVARARESGSLGELVRVESLNNRKPYFARVSGIQKVEVYARAIAAGGTNLQTDTRSARSRQSEIRQSEQPMAVRPAEHQAMYQEHVSSIDTRKRPSPAVRTLERNELRSGARRQTTVSPRVAVDPGRVSRPARTTREAYPGRASLQEPIESHAVSNPATPTRLHWTRRSTK